MAIPLQSVSSLQLCSSRPSSEPGLAGLTPRCWTLSEQRMRRHPIPQLLTGDYGGRRLGIEDFQTTPSEAARETNPRILSRVGFRCGQRPTEPKVRRFRTGAKTRLPTTPDRVHHALHAASSGKPERLAESPQARRTPDVAGFASQARRFRDPRVHVRVHAGVLGDHGVEGPTLGTLPHDGRLAGGRIHDRHAFIPPSRLPDVRLHAVAAMMSGPPGVWRLYLAGWLMIFG